MNRFIFFLRLKRTTLIGFTIASNRPIYLYVLLDLYSAEWPMPDILITILPNRKYRNCVLQVLRLFGVAAL